MDNWKQLLPKNIVEKYELYNFNNAVEIMSQAYSKEFTEIMGTLDQFNVDLSDITEKGGNESNVPKKLSALLRPLGWKEVEITGDLIVKLYEGKKRNTPFKEFALEEFISGHKIDYVKGEIAFDMEWNSKDQTFDRDLYALRAFYECGVITCGVILTRSAELNRVFNALGKDIKDKYGASTTWMGKLIPRIQARRHGGCPLLIVGITPKAIADWEEK